MADKNEKFIMFGIDDDRSKKVAEILGNKTCKRILDYLSEIPEASEKDIADAIQSPLNTVEYNLQKLISVGLVEKTKNFFWSVRGKKIPMYKVAKKHIVISPKSSPSLTSLKTIIPSIIGVIAIIALIAFLLPQNQIEQQGIQTFKSSGELKNFLEKNTIAQGRYFEESVTSAGSLFGSGASADTSASSATQKATDYSETNIQVAGVDEADIIKNDGKYIYIVSGNKVVIVNAFPAENMEVLSEIKFAEGENPSEIFINDDKLIVFTQTYNTIFYGTNTRCIDGDCVLPEREQRTIIYIYDISNKEKPEKKDEISTSGNYFDSRMIGNYVYVIANQYIYSDILPAIETNGNVDVVQPNEIYYSDIRDYSFQYTIILAINVNNGDTSEKTILTGSTQNIFVSKENIYTTYSAFPEQTGIGIVAERTSNNEKTIVHKISIDKDEIEYFATGEVPGYLLNQFSMDEFKGDFRIATTSGDVWNSEEPSKNNVYILNGDLEVIGRLEGLAPGEKIYSVRFLGERGYVVTFKKVDPLFVIDLSDPENPEVLGKLKIPGYSDYLHPYDENHIIGIGKEAVDASESDIGRRDLDFAWYQGVKMAIFDVSDVENPVELHKVVIGDRGTDSPVLQDHKAFLFDREKELLVLPVTLAEIKGEKTQDNQYGEYTFQGAYVYKINLEDGFDFKGRITHYEDDEVAKKSGSYWYGDRNIFRSLYMDDVLYTISNKIVKANDLDDFTLDEINQVELPYEETYYPYVAY